MKVSLVLSSPVIYMSTSCSYVMCSPEMFSANFTFSSVHNLVLWWIISLSYVPPSFVKKKSLVQWLSVHIVIYIYHNQNGKTSKFYGKGNTVNVGVTWSTRRQRSNDTEENMRAPFLPLALFSETGVTFALHAALGNRESGVMGLLARKRPASCSMPLSESLHEWMMLQAQSR